MDRLFNALISGDRAGAFEVLDETIAADATAEVVLDRLLWPTLCHIQNLHRNDQLSRLSFHYATRLMRQIVAHQRMHLERQPGNGITCLVMSGEEQSEELAAQIASDLLEAAGYSVLYAGGGIANDEIVGELGERNVDKLIIFGAVAPTVPQTRLLIDRLHDLGKSKDVQIIVGGGVFNRAEGLAEEIGADLWCEDPIELVQVMEEEPERRMTPDQRTVGRRRKSNAQAA